MSVKTKPIGCPPHTFNPSRGRRIAVSSHTKKKIKQTKSKELERASRQNSTGCTQHGENRNHQLNLSSVRTAPTRVKSVSAGKWGKLSFWGIIDESKQAIVKGST